MSSKAEEAKPGAKDKGKKDKATEEDDLTEDDRKLRDDLALSVERVQDPAPGVQLAALNHLRSEIKSSTASMTSVPKPLKFLRPHYGALKDFFATLSTGEPKQVLADVLSVLAMTMGEAGARESLTFKLQGDMKEMGEWGHEYVRNLAGEIGEAFQARQDEAAEAQEAAADGGEAVPADVSDLMHLVNLIVPYNMQHNAEHEACDLLMEVERIGDILDHVDEHNYKRVCRYLLSTAAYLPEPEDEELYAITRSVFIKFGCKVDSTLLALKLSQREAAQAVFDEETDPAIRMQLAYVLGRQQLFVFSGEDDEDEELLTKVNGNERMHEHFHYLGTDLDVMEAKAPEDIYKNELLSGMTNVAASAKSHMADTFVNAFVNVGFGTDTLMTDNGPTWIQKNRDLGQLCATASVGMVHMWDSDTGCQQLDQFSYSDNVNVRAGNFLGVGLASCGVRNLFEAAMGLLSEAITDDNPHIVRVASILGFGLAYAGTQRDDVSDMLTPILEEDDVAMEVVAVTALAVGFIHVGSANGDVVDAIVNNAFFDRTETDLKSSLTRFLCLGLSLVFLGRGEAIDATHGALSAILSEPTRSYALVTLESCAYAGTGNVLKVQSMLHHCVEHLEDNDEHQGVAVIGIGLIAMGEELGSDMCLRAMDHLLQYGEPVIRRAVPLALGLLNLSNPVMRVMDTLSKLSHDHDQAVAASAVFAMGLAGAGTNNARVAQMLRALSEYYAKEGDLLYVVRLAQGLLHAGKGTITMSPWSAGGFVMNKIGVAGVLTVLHSMLSYKEVLLAKPHMLFMLAPAITPRSLITLGEDGKPLPVNVRVGKAVDTVGQAGKPKSITGFQTYTTPVLLGAGDRAELATEQYIALSSHLEGVVVLRQNPDWKE